MGQNTERQKVGYAILNGMRWLLFIPGGFAVGVLVVFVGVLLPMLLRDLFASSHPDWVEHPSFFIISRSILLLVLSFVVGFSTTAYGARIAPSENKKIPGLIITVSLALIFLTDFTMKFLVKIMGAKLSLACCAITVLTSLVAALRLKPVKRAAFMSDLVYPEHIDSDRAQTDQQPQSGAKIYTYCMIVLAVGKWLESNLPAPYDWIVVLVGMVIILSMPYHSKIARFFKKS